MKFCLYVIHFLFDLGKIWYRDIYKKLGLLRFVKMDSVKVITSPKHVNEFLFILHMLTVHFRQNLIQEI